MCMHMYVVVCATSCVRSHTHRSELAVALLNADWGAAHENARPGASEEAADAADDAWGAGGKAHRREDGAGTKTGGPRAQ